MLYAPPYDSPIEDAFAMIYAPWAASEVTMTPQVKVETICGNFILDFLITTPAGYRVAIECDGKEFHEPSRDEWRDAMILGADHADAIYRLRGEDINIRLEEIMYILSNLEPELFDARALPRFKALASPQVLSMNLDRGLDNFITTFDRAYDKGFIHVEARRQDIPKGQRRFWKTAYDYALKVGGGQLDEVIACYRRKPYPVGVPSPTSH